VCTKLNTTRGCGLDVTLGFYALVLLVTGCVAAGVCAAVIHTWSLRALAFSLETRLAVVEGTLTREVKARAGQERWKKPDKTDQLLTELALSTNANQRPKNWWETTIPREVPSGK